MTLYSRRSVLRLGGGLAAVAAVPLQAAPARAQAPTTWNAYTYTPAATLAPARGLARIAEGIDKATGGALKIKVHLGGSLPIGASDISNALSDNVVQLGDDGFFHGNLPITGILRLPMLITTPEEFDRAAAIMRPYFEQAYAAKGVVLLAQYYYPLQVAWSRAPLASSADVKGRKFRVTSPEQGEFVRRLGGTPVTLGAAEVPSALDRGVVDGVFTASSGGGRIWKDLLKSSYRLGPNFFDASIAANKGALEKLAPDVRAKLLALVADTAPWITTELRNDEGAVTQQLAAGGITMTEAKTEDIESARKLLAPYWDEWATSRGSEAVAALGKVRAVLGR
jgi:TRAP-type C4-dicarboxylate transport system substrate-binding protein